MQTKGRNVTSNQTLRSLKNLNIDESVKRKKLIYAESWYDKIDRFVIYFFFSWGFILPFLIYFDPHRNHDKTGIEYYLVFVFIVFCAYVIFRKVTEKKLTEIKSQFDLEENRKLVNKYCGENGFEKYRNSKNIIVYNSESMFNMNPSYKTSRIFLLKDQSIYITMIKENYRLNIPVLLSPAPARVLSRGDCYFKGVLDHTKGFVRQRRVSCSCRAHTAVFFDASAWFASESTRLD
jgi:hypothetical protein